MSRAVGIKGRGTEMCSVLVGRAEGIILPGFGQARIKTKKHCILTQLLIVGCYVVDACFSLGRKAV